MIRYNKYNQCKKEIDKELMPILWYPSRWWDYCMLKDEKKKEIEKLWNNESVSE